MGNLTSIYQMFATIVEEKKFFLVQPIERWKTPFWEKNISGHDIIQHTQIATDNAFVLK